MASVRRGHQRAGILRAAPPLFPVAQARARKRHHHSLDRRIRRRGCARLFAVENLDRGVLLRVFLPHHVACAERRRSGDVRDGACVAIDREEHAAGHRGPRHHRRLVPQLRTALRRVLSHVGQHPPLLPGACHAGGLDCFRRDRGRACASCRPHVSRGAGARNVRAFAARPVFPPPRATGFSRRCCSRHAPRSSLQTRLPRLPEPPQAPRSSRR